jgi:hypothetical protein
MCTRIYSGSYIGTVTSPQFEWVCESCLAVGAEPFVFGPPYAPEAQPSYYAELRVRRQTLGPATPPPCEGDYGNPTGVLRAGGYTGSHM